MINKDAYFATKHKNETAKQTTTPLNTCNRKGNQVNGDPPNKKKSRKKNPLFGVHSEPIAARL
jgi:hypothetical protein